MHEASEALEFEEAAVYRDYIEAAKALSATQRVVMQQSKDIDIVIPAKGTEEIHMVIFFVREGKLSGRETYEMEAMPGSDKSELVSAFINQHYSRLPNFPREILLTHMPEDKEILEQYLAEMAGHNVKLIQPQKGEKKALVDLACRDVVEMVKTIDKRAEAARERRHDLGSEIFDILKEMNAVSGDYDGREFRVEAYDISNTNGVDTVGAMVVFEGLRADKKSYRKFKVRSVTGQDDYASMREILSRRFNRVYSGDEGFEVLPDIILMDGGKGHVSTALEVTEASGFDIPVVGMVKDDRHRTRALVYRKPYSNEYEEIPLQGKNLLFRYIGRIQEEVHRFAIEYHRKVRSRRVSVSVLDDIEGIGPARRRALLEHFGSVDNIRAATPDELEKAESMNRKAAENVWRFFHK